MTTKYRNTKKKMASLGLKKDISGEYVLIDPDDPTAEFVPVRRYEDKQYMSLKKRIF